ncbi:MAG: DUF748 domain-containing protein, partial [Planctomycetaceae bacterium]|nr:DUF748 domain-containing protein [Planctomycetaceae bacterium]
MNAPESAPPPAPPPAASDAPKKKRWKKIFLIGGASFLGLLLLVLIVGPSIIGSIAKSKIESIAGEKLQAVVRVGGVSFSWSGHVVVDGLRIVPRNFSDPLVEVKQVDVRVDVGAALGGRYIAAVEVLAPKMIVEKGADGKFNYEFPPQPPSPSELKKAGPSGKPAFVQANLTVRDGEVRIRGKGRETSYQNLAVHAKVDTLEKPVEYDLSLESPMKDAVKVTGALNVATISGPATLTLERFSLKNLTGAARAYSDVLELDGTVNGSFRYELKGAPRFVGKGGLDIDGFSAVLHDPVLKTDRTLRLDKLTLRHEGGIDERGSGRHVVTLACGTAVGATVTADVVDAFGARVVKTQVSADSDLAALAEVLTKVGALPKGMSLAGAVRVRGTCDSRGPTQADLEAKKLRVAAKVDLDVAGKDIRLVMDGKPMRLDGFNLHHAGTLDEAGTGKNALTLTLGKAIAASAQVDMADAMGPSPAVKAALKVDSDLGELGRLLEKLIGLKPDMALEGTGAIQGTVEAKGAESVNADLALSVKNLVAIDAKDRKRHEIDPSIVLNVAGGWNGRTKTGTADVVRLDSSFATMNGKGGASLAGENPEIRDTAITLEADLAKLGGKLASFMERPPSLGGTISLRASAQGEKLGVAGELKALRFDQYGPVDAVLKHEGTLDAKGSGRQTLTLESGKAAVLKVVVDVKEAYKDTRATAVQATLSSDLAALSVLLPGVVQLKPGTSLAGTLALIAKAETKGSTWAKVDLSFDADNLS